MLEIRRQRVCLGYMKNTVTAKASSWSKSGGSKRKYKGRHVEQMKSEMQLNKRENHN